MMVVTDGDPRTETRSGPQTETCDLCGAVVDPDPGESRFQAVVAHFEAVHIDAERVQ